MAAGSSHCGSAVGVRIGVGSTADIERWGRPSCRKCVSSSSTVSWPLRTRSTPSPVNVPRLTASTPWRSQTASIAGH